MLPTHETFIVNDSLRALPLDRRVFTDLKLRDEWTKRVPSGPPDQELPVSDDGTLRVGTLYPSSTEASVRYYLPDYELATARGNYLTSLKWRTASDGPDSPLAWLTVELVADAPAHQQFTLREIEHQAVCRIGYIMPVVDAGQIPAPPTEAPDQDERGRFVGEWTNVDAATRGMTRLKIDRDASGELSVHGFGKCHPSDCDWGVVAASRDGGALRARYDFGFKTTTIVARRNGQQLVADVVDDYTDADGRTDRSTTYVLERQAFAPAPALWIDVGALTKVSANTRRCRMPVHTAEEFDRLLQVMTDDAYGARLEIQCFATVGHRRWRYLVAVQNRTLAVDTRLTALRTAFAPAEAAAGAAPVVRDHRTTTRPPARPDVRDHRTTTRPAKPPVVVRIPPRGRRPVDDLPDIERPPRDKPVPDRPAEPEPPLIAVPVECRQAITPFTFPAASYGYMFDLPEKPGSRHVLLKDELEVGPDQRITLYQDSAFRDRFFYEPEEFRLARLDEPPFLPDLRMGFVNVDVNVDVEASGAAPDQPGAAGEPVGYSVLMVYRALPYLAPQHLAKARARYGSQARFSALEPSQSELTLRLPRDGGQPQPVQQTGAQVSFADGILSTVELSAAEFERVFAAFQAPGSLGVEGSVKATLVDGSVADVPVQLSLAEITGSPFDQSFGGPVPGGPAGRYSVLLTNRIESPVRITRLHGLDLGSGVLAAPLDALPIVVAPGQTATLTYQVAPADAAVPDLEPVLEAAVEPAHAVLWPLLLWNQGWTSSTFPVAVTIDAGYFAPVPGTAALTGVRVEFESDQAVTLTPQAPSATVQLRMPLLGYLLKDGSATRYRYRVRNLHGDSEGAVGDLLDGEGDLQVAPATEGA